MPFPTSYERLFPPECPPRAGARHRWPNSPANTAAIPVVHFLVRQHDEHSLRSGSCLSFLTCLSTAAPPLPSACPVWETRYHRPPRPDPAPTQPSFVFLIPPTRASTPTDSAQ